MHKVTGRPAGAFLFRFSQTEPDKLSLTYSAAAAGSTAAETVLRPKHCLVYNLGAAGFGLSANAAPGSGGSSSGSGASGGSSHGGAFESIAAFVAAHSGSRLAEAVASKASAQFKAELDREAAEAAATAAEAASTEAASAAAAASAASAAAAAVAAAEVSGAGGVWPSGVGSAEAWAFYASADLLMGGGGSLSSNALGWSSGGARPLLSSPLLPWPLLGGHAPPPGAGAPLRNPLPLLGNGASSSLGLQPLLPPPQEPPWAVLPQPHPIRSLDRQISAPTADEWLAAQLATEDRALAAQRVRPRLAPTLSLSHYPLYVSLSRLCFHHSVATRAVDSLSPSQSVSISCASVFLSAPASTRICAPPLPAPRRP